MSKFIGIDLGTTNSAVAYINSNGMAEIIPNEHGQTVTPSVIYFGQEGPIVGQEARDYQASGAIETASFFKPNIGNPEFVLSFRGCDYTAIDLSALILGYLKRQAESFFSEEVTNAVITVPAYFTHIDRTATLEAGRKAGLNVLKIISEPTAAALAYGLRAVPSERRVLVYDLGGGTFDISLIAISPTELRVIATDGDHHLGGKDWDDRLVQYLAARFESEFGVDLQGEYLNELYLQSERLKHALSARQRADIRVEADGNTGTYTVTRELFEGLTSDLVGRTQLLMERVLTEADLSWSDISGILPVGGSTRMPMIRSLIEQMAGKPPMGGINPDEAVALGAAIQAAMEMAIGSAPMLLLGHKSTIDVIAHSLGMIAESADSSRYINSILIPKNMPIPSSQTRPYRMKMPPIRNDNLELEVFLTQGESEDPQHCTYLGLYTFRGFPTINSKTELPLEITYHYDKNGVVHISAVEQTSGKPLELIIQPIPPDVPARFAGRPIDQHMRRHLTVYLAFDLSGSMIGAPLNAAQRAAEEFVSYCNLTTSSIGLVSFSDSVLVDCLATQNDKEIREAIRNLSVGKTGIGNAGHPFDEIYQLLSNISGLRYVVVLTDGVWANQDAAAQQARLCHDAGIEIISIGFGGADRAFLNQIASSSEQNFFIKMNRLTETFSTIAQELTLFASDRSGGEKIS